MSLSPEEIASDFLEIASEQRLSILLKLSEKKYKMSIMAKELDATVPEIHRNFTRLVKSGLILKDAEGNYELTLFGQTICVQIPSLVFMSKNQKYFKNHSFGDIPTKFIQRVGALENSQLLSGYVKVLDQWQTIYKNSNEFIFNILVEVSYTPDFIDTLTERLQKNVKINSIFSESAVISKDRKKVLEKSVFKNYISNDALKRKMKKDIKVVVVLNEKEAGVSFPTSDGEVDLSKMFYSTDPLFHEWCLDFFNQSWKTATSFQENKLKG